MGELGVQACRLSGAGHLTETGRLGRSQSHGVMSEQYELPWSLQLYLRIAGSGSPKTRSLFLSGARPSAWALLGRGWTASYSVQLNYSLLRNMSAMKNVPTVDIFELNYCHAKLKKYSASIRWKIQWKKERTLPNTWSTCNITESVLTLLAKLKSQRDFLLTGSIKISRSVRQSSPLCLFILPLCVSTHVHVCVHIYELTTPCV